MPGVPAGRPVWGKGSDQRLGWNASPIARLATHRARGKGEWTIGGAGNPGPLQIPVNGKGRRWVGIGAPASGAKRWHFHPAVFQSGNCHCRLGTTHHTPRDHHRRVNAISCLASSRSSRSVRVSLLTRARDGRRSAFTGDQPPPCTCLFPSGKQSLKD
jgi:hypothetical protein